MVLFLKVADQMANEYREYRMDLFLKVGDQMANEYREYCEYRMDLFLKVADQMANEYRKYCEHCFHVLYAPCCGKCGEFIIGRVIKVLSAVDCLICPLTAIMGSTGHVTLRPGDTEAQLLILLPLSASPGHSCHHNIDT